jgi:hypothetical protein
MKYASINPAARYGISGNPSALSFLVCIMRLTIMPSINPVISPKKPFTVPRRKAQAADSFASAPPIDLLLQIIAVEITYIQ